MTNKRVVSDDSESEASINSSSASTASRRTMMKSVGGTALAAALAGCSTLLNGGDSTNANSGSDNKDIPDEPIEVGMQTFLEGAPGVLGVQDKQGAEIAVDRVNKAGGIAGRQINLDIVEEAEGAKQNYERFIDEGKDYTIGPVSSGSAANLAPVIEDNEKVNIILDGATTQVYDEAVTNPKYTFRYHNTDSGETIGLAKDTVNFLGVDSINTVANIGPNYAFGQSQWENYRLALQHDTDAEVAYSGFPELGAGDFSTHISSVKNKSPDVLFTSLWGGDAVTFMRQAQANNLFEHIGVLAGTVLYTGASGWNKDLVKSAGDVLIGGRNYVWNYPSFEVWPPNEDLFNEIKKKYGDEGFPPSGFFMSGYGAVSMLATGLEKAVNLLDKWPSQEELAEVLSSHGFYTPAGYHSTTPEIYNGRQNLSNYHSGTLTWSEEHDVPAFDNVNTYPPKQIQAPPGMGQVEWIESW